MTRNIIFYGLVLGLLCLIGWAGYRLFYSDNSAEIAKKVSNSISTPKMQRDSQSESPRHGTDGWNDSRLKSAINSGNLGDLKGQALIQNNLKNLTDLYNRGEDDQLLALVNKLMEENPDVKEYPAFLGDYYYNEGNWVEAEKAITKLVDLDPQNQFARTTLGEVLAIQGKYDDALKNMEQALQQDSRSMDALHGVLSISDMKGNPEEGSKRIESIAKAEPGNGNAASVYADVLMSQNKPEEAKKVVEAAMAADPNNANVYSKAGEFAEREGNHPEAVRLYETAISKEKYPEGKLLTMENLARVLYTQGNIERAKSIFNEMLVIKPNYENAVQGLKMMEASEKMPIGPMKKKG